MSFTNCRSTLPQLQTNSREYHFESHLLSGKLELKFYSSSTTMKVLSVTLSLLFAAGFIQTAAGIQCDSFCAACWKIGSPGVDIKMSCGTFGNCPYPCPSGYNNIHCANSDRCWWVDLLIYITISFSSRVGVFQWTNKHSQIGARNLIVKHLVRAIVESTTVKVVRKAAKCRIQARSVQVDYFLFFCLPIESSVPFVYQ